MTSGKCSSRTSPEAGSIASRSNPVGRTMLTHLHRRVFLPPEASLAVGRFEAALRESIPPLLYGLRLWASVTLALYVAFWLELDNPFWAGTSAAIVCLPQLGASLRKGWFRMIGTLVGAVVCVVLVACFPQDRILFLGFLALWAAACAFVATLLRNFASYAAALAGYTVALSGAVCLAPPVG